MPPTASPRAEGMRAGHSPLGRLRHRRHARGADEMDVFAVTAVCDTSVEELRTRTLPAVHPRPANVLDGVFRARVGVAGDVEGMRARGMVLRRTEGHAAPPSACA